MRNARKTKYYVRDGYNCLYKIEDNKLYVMGPNYLYEIPDQWYHIQTRSKNSNRFKELFDLKQIQDVEAMLILIKAEEAGEIILE